MNRLWIIATFTLVSACGNKVGFQESATYGSLGVCAGISCELTPLTGKPSVVTILMALGDQVNSQFVVNQASNQLIAETVVRYASPRPNPRVLVVVDSNSGKESPEDSSYVADTLLARYDANELKEPVTGLTDADLIGYDVVWFNNPGAPMGNVRSRDALLRFAGGVIVQGDDLSRGTNFALDDLTGLHYVDNGTTVTCAGTAYPHDNNAGYQYRVTLDATKIPGANSSTINFVYGNDIDDTTVVRPDLEVLARARGGPEACTVDRPAIVRYQK